MLLCSGCGRSFTPTYRNQIKCKKDCGRRQYSSRYGKNHAINFIGVDGEGVSRPPDSNGYSTHDYVMLSVGDQTLDIRTTGRNRLTHHDIFPFLYDQFLASPKSSYVGFYLSYDFTHWTRSLSPFLGAELYDKSKIEARRNKLTGIPFPVVDTDSRWEFDLLARRRFKLRPHVCTPPKGQVDGCRVPYCNGGTRGGSMRYALPPGKTSWPWMYICDAGPFWQMSLLAALDPKTWPKPVVTEDEYAIIKAGKSERSHVYPISDTSFLDTMALYNRTENRALASAMETLNRGFVDIDVRIPNQDWYGPGRAAQLWLDSQIKETHSRKELFEGPQAIPEWVQDIARATYYGGWFEQMIHGHVLTSNQEVYEYDINSAYPDIISRLPCLCNNTRWFRESVSGNSLRRPDHGELSIVLARVIGSDPYIGAMHHRTPKGLICRPHETTGAYWYHELQAAISAGIVDTVEPYEQIMFRMCEHDAPLQGIRELYNQRLSVGKKSPQGKALKLIYNSSYGKTAQSIGNPKYGNPIWASLITAGCRTKILDAIATHPQGTEAVTMVATDAVYFTMPHPALDSIATNQKDELGAWDGDVKTNLTQFMPGIYWDNKIRRVLDDERTDGIRRNASQIPNKSRGINARDLADQITTLDQMFNGMLSSTENAEWPTLDVTVGFTLTTGSLANARGKWNTCGDVITGATRRIDSRPVTKRLPEPYQSSAGIRTPVYGFGDGKVSTPYSRFFGGEPFNVEWGEGLDGANVDAFARIIRGEID